MHQARNIKAISSSSSSLSLESFREPAQRVIGPEENKVQHSVPSSKKLDQHVQQHQVINVGILWTFKLLMSKMSLYSCGQLKLLFSAMFNYSNVVKSFQLGKTKCGY